jgi:alcohol dehydrogenase class IV
MSSPKHFEFATSGRILFGEGVLQEVGKLAAELGNRALLVTGKNASRAEGLLKLAHKQGVATAVFSVFREPDIETVEQGIATARSQKCNLVIGFGGGSAIDAAKAIAVMLNNPGGLLDYVEVIGAGKTLKQPAISMIAIPTTAGTGSEVTRNAVLASMQHRLKVSLRSRFLLPTLALVDPELSYGLPPAITARTGLDALTQVIEPYVSSRANPFTDGLCVEGMHRAARSLRIAFSDGQNRDAREDMAVASLFGGLALANAGLGAVHGFAGVLGGMFSAPHGALCAALLAPVTEMNLRALRARQPDSSSLKRFDDVARILTGSPGATADDAVPWLREVVSELEIPSLGSYDITRNHTAEIVAKASEASSMKANPLPLTPEELSAILVSAI